MKRPSRFNWRYVLPAIAVVGVVVVGSYLLVATHAATLTGCAAYTYKITGNTNPAPSTSSGTAAVCVNYIEKILNGVYQANYAGFQGYADQFSAASPAVAKFSGYLPDAQDSVYSDHYSAQFMNRLEAFQEFFAYSGQDLILDGTLTSESPTVQAICGVAQHMPNPDTGHAWEQASTGAASHFGCGTLATAPTVSSRIKPGVGTLALICNGDGTGTASNVKFGSPYGPTTATLTITYAKATATTINYSTSDASHTALDVVEGSDKVDAGTWKASLVVTASWNGHPTTTSPTTSSAACKKPAVSSSGSASSGSGSTTSSGSGSVSGDSGGCDPSDPTCLDSGASCDLSDPSCGGYTFFDPCVGSSDPSCTGDSSGGYSFGDSFDTCDPSDPSCSGDTTDSGSFDCTDPTDPTCGGSSGISSDGSSVRGSGGSSATTGSSTTRHTGAVSRFVQTARSILDSLF